MNIQSLVDESEFRRARRQKHYDQAEELLEMVGRGEMRTMAEADAIAMAHVHALLAGA